MNNDEVDSGAALSETEVDKQLFDQLAGFSSERVGFVIASFVGFLAVWHVAALFQLTYFPPPLVEVLAALVVELTAPVSLSTPFTGTELPMTRPLVKLVQSLCHYMPSLLIGTLLGVFTGIAVGWNIRVDSVSTPVTHLLRPIPPLTWTGFAVIRLGVDHQGVMFIMTVGSSQVNFYSTYDGVEGVSEDLKEVAVTLDVDDDWTMIRKVVIPTASPSVMAGIRTNIDQCWVTAVATELIVGVGAGYEILNTVQDLVVDVLAVYMLVTSIVFLVSGGLFHRVERRVLEWRARATT